MKTFNARQNRTKTFNAKDKYEKQAFDFLRDTDSTLEVFPTGYRSMPWDKDGIKRNTVRFTLTRGENSYSADFGLSIADTKNGRIYPKAYDILACLSPYCHFIDVDECALEFEIEKPSEALRVFNALTEEAEALQKMYSADELDQLAEIV